MFGSARTAFGGARLVFRGGMTVFGEALFGRLDVSDFNGMSPFVEGGVAKIALFSVSISLSAVGAIGMRFALSCVFRRGTLFI